MSRFLSKEATTAEAEELHQMLADIPDKQFLLEMLRAYFTPTSVARAETQPEEDLLDERFLKMLERSDTAEAGEAGAGLFSVAAGSLSAAGGRIAVTGGLTDDALSSNSESYSTAEPPVIPRFPTYRQRLAIAAVLAPLLVVAIYLLARTAAPEPVQPIAQKTSEILSKAGARTRLVLPDGTRVWLNSSSKLRYFRASDGSTREVELEGEAYFDVAKDMQHPFIVHVDSLDVRVLGTAFTIKSYPQDQTIEATLLAGGIEILRKGNLNAPRVILRPNEKLVFNKRLTPVAVSSASSSSSGAKTVRAISEIMVNSIPRNVPDSEKVETAWMYNRLVLDGDYFGQVTAKMERWYNVRITIRDTALNSYRFGGTFANETVEQALTALQLTVPFNYKISNNQIEIYAKN